MTLRKGRTVTRSDDELYRQYLSGDQASGDELMLRYADPLVAYLNAFLHDPQDAEDLMLDCFAVILVKKPRIREGNVRAYIFKMARYKAFRLYRRKTRRGEFSIEDLPEGGMPADSAGGSAGAVEKSERDATLVKCMDRIAPQYREALWLFYSMDMSYAQAAEVLNCGTKKIDNLLANGRKQLRKELEKEGITREDI